MNNYLQRAMEMAPELTRHRRTIHQNPETGNHLPLTSSYVFDQLTRMGYQPQLLGGGVCGTVGRPGRVFLLRADMDALPMKEESGLPFASGNPEAAHCCGHDLHTAMLLGAARLLKEKESSLEGTVKLMFQPGEECLTGARGMLDAGILENPKVDAAMAIHVNSTIPAGALIVLHGPVAASADRFSIRVEGKSCHGGRPHEGVDPISIICHIHTALQELQARELKAGEIGVLTVGTLHAGNAVNVIPDEAVMGGTIRTFDADVQRMLKQRMQEISENTARAFRGKAQVEFEPGYAIPMVCEEETSAAVRDALLATFRPEQVRYLATHFSGSEDFCFVAEKVPSAFVALGAAVGPDVKYGQHHPRVQFNESCLPVGAAAYAAAATQWLHNHP